MEKKKDWVLAKRNAQRLEELKIGFLQHLMGNKRLYYQGNTGIEEK
jgi:hypothetical protein